MIRVILLFLVLLAGCATTKPLAFSENELRSAGIALGTHVKGIFPPASTVFALPEIDPFSVSAGAALRELGYGVVDAPSLGSTAISVQLIDVGDGAIWVFNARKKTARQLLNRNNDALLPASFVTVSENE